MILPSRFDHLEVALENDYPSAQNGYETSASLAENVYNLVSML